MRVFFSGMRGNVMAASGPWRTSGDWWREDAWQQDEWDLEIRFDLLAIQAVASKSQPRITAERPQHGVYCLYFDSIRQSWFVRGIYD